MANPFNIIKPEILHAINHKGLIIEGGEIEKALIHDVHTEGGFKRISFDTIHCDSLHGQGFNEDALVFQGEPLNPREIIKDILIVWESLGDNPVWWNIDSYASNPFSRLNDDVLCIYIYHRESGSTLVITNKEKAVLCEDGIIRIKPLK